MLRRMARAKRALSDIVRPQDETWEFPLDDGVIKVFGPEYSAWGKWVVTIFDDDGSSESDELTSREEVGEFLKLFNIDFDVVGEYWPKIDDKHGEKPSFFRHISDADMKDVENSAQYHSNFLDYKQYSN